MRSASRPWFRKRAAAPIRAGARRTRYTAVPLKPTRAGVAALAAEAHGQYAQAEALYRRSEAFRRAS